MTIYGIWWWGPSSGDLGRVEYPFIAKVVVSINVLSLGQINLFENYLYDGQLHEAIIVYELLEFM